MVIIALRLFTMTEFFEGVWLLLFVINLFFHSIEIVKQILINE